MEEIVFHHTLPIQLRFNDVDKFGHVNNTVYFSFYDLGKTEYFGSVCTGVDWEKIGLVVVHIEANFVKQIFASDHIAVQTAVSKIGTKSFHLVQQVIDTKTNEVKCVCKSRPSYLQIASIHSLVSGMDSCLSRSKVTMMDLQTHFTSLVFVSMTC